MGKTDLQLAEAHRYKLLDGTPCVNVTAVAECLDPGDKAGRMAGAAAKIAKTGGDYRAEWNAKRDLGTRVHRYAEAFLRGKSAEVVAGDEKHCDALERFFEERKPTPIEIESIVLSHHGYGGRLDAICEMDDDEGERVIALPDWKSGGFYPTALTLQLAAYRFADGIAVYHPNGKLDTVRPLPEIEATCGVYLQADGTYKVRWVEAGKAAFAHFVNLLLAYKWAKEVER